jgi:hypothetical protein
VYVDVTAEGQIQLIDDQTIYPPLSISAVTLLSQAIPAAQDVVNQLALTQVVQQIAAILALPEAQGTFTVTGTTLTAELNNFAFTTLATQWGAVPVDGMFAFGPATVHTTGV